MPSAAIIDRNSSSSPPYWGCGATTVLGGFSCVVTVLGGGCRTVVVEVGLGLADALDWAAGPAGWCDPVLNATSATTTTTAAVINAAPTATRAWVCFCMSSPRWTGCEG